VNLTIASFTVKATMDQSIRWKRAAAGEGHRAVGTWLAGAADAYLRARARAGQPIALAWQRGHFLVALESGEVRVYGMISTPFGYYRGDGRGPGYRGMMRYALVLLATGRLVAVLKTAAQVRTLAAELAPVLLREDRELAEGITGRHQREGV
jgi:hypothetical protein